MYKLCVSRQSQFEKRSYPHSNHGQMVVIECRCGSGRWCHSLNKSGAGSFDCQKNILIAQRNGIKGGSLAKSLTFWMGSQMKNSSLNHFEVIQTEDLETKFEFEIR